MQDSDAVLVERASAGQEPAFHEIYRRHSRYIAGVVYRLLGDDGAVDDMVQETFVSAAKALGSLKDPGQLRLWLVTIAVRHTRHFLKKRRRRRLFHLDFAAGEPTCTAPQSDPALASIYEALDLLPSKLRILWILHRVEGLTIKEVADVCESSPTTVKRRLRLARTKLEGRIDVD